MWRCEKVHGKVMCFSGETKRVIRKKKNAKSQLEEAKKDAHRENLERKGDLTQRGDKNKMAKVQGFFWSQMQVVP